MKLLVDTCVSGLVARSLREAGHDVVWAGDWTPDPGDAAILESAVKESRVIITLDKDFGELVIGQGRPHAGMIRLRGFRVSEQPDVLLNLLVHYRSSLEERAILTVERSRVRVRLPPTP